MPTFKERLSNARSRRAAAQRPKRAPKPRPQNTRQDLRERLIVAAIAVPIAIILIVQGGITFTIALIVLGWVCLHELFVMFEDTRPARLAAFAALPAILLAAHYGGQQQVFLMLAIALPLVFLVAAFQTREGGAASIAFSLMGIYYIGIALAFGVMLRDLPNGDGIVADVLIGTFIGDSAAYLGGRSIGRHKLAPTISPNKTVEGLVIGIAFGVLAVWFAGVYQDFLTGLQALLLGFVVCVVAPLGDLFESYLKRDAGKKDTGSLFGAHGGALDRLDAALFTAVAGYFVYSAMLN
jgi:phosphatidate cytidylyltransferase